MRNGAIAAFLLLSAAACSTAPQSYVGSTPTPGDGAYTCALREINQLGYTVTNADREAGFITAQKQTSGLATALLTGSNYHDRLTVSVFDADSGDARTVRVTAAQTQENALAFGNASQTGVAPSDSGKADARAVLSACTEGGITEQQSMSTYQAFGTLAD